MRMDIISLGVLIIASSASIFGNLGHAEVSVSTVPEAIPSADIAVVSVSEVQDTCLRVRGEAMATSLRYLGPDGFDLVAATGGCLASD